MGQFKVFYPITIRVKDERRLEAGMHALTNTKVQDNIYTSATFSAATSLSLAIFSVVASLSVSSAFLFTAYTIKYRL